MDELKACPFCGSSNIQPAPLSDYEWYRCNDCDALSGRGGAIGWNSRPLEDALQAEIARLRDVLEEIRGVAGNKANPEADKAVIIGLVNDALNEEVRG